MGTGARGQKNYNDGATGPKKKSDDVFSRLDTIHERDNQTDAQTDGQTNGHLPTAKTALTHKNRNCNDYCLLTGNHIRLVNAPLHRTIVKLTPD